MASRSEKPNVAAVPPDPLTAAERQQLVSLRSKRSLDRSSFTPADAGELDRLERESTRGLAGWENPQPRGVSDPAAVAAKPTAPDLFQQQRDNHATLADQLPPPSSPPSPANQPETYALAEPEVTGPPHDPLRDFAGPNDPAAAQRGSDGKPVDVNIVGSIPLPVYITQGGQTTVQGSGQPGNQQPGEHDAYGNPIDAEHKALSGMTVQESFNKFAGGYAAGYPIHNLKTLRKNLAGPVSKMRQAAKQLGMAGLRGLTGGRLGRVVQKVKPKKEPQEVKIVAPLPIPVTISDKPVGSESNAPGNAATTVVTTAVLGPAAGAIAAFGGALAVASQEVYSFARAQEEEVRRLSELNAALAMATAELDVGRLERDIRMGEATEGSGRYLTESIDRFEEGLAPIQEAATNLANTVGGVLLDGVTALMTPLTEIAKVVNDIIGFLRRTPDAAPVETAWGIFRRMADAEEARASTPAWPGSGVGAPGRRF